jgi:tetratricopeptide (TPR) repeat protein
VVEQDIFLAAIEIADPVERSTFLEKACAGNVPLRQLVEDMLQVYPELGTFLESPAAGLARASHPPVSAGRFQLGPELARGGMGVVYSARDESLGRDVAVKVLHERYVWDALVVERFLDEARITAQLQHPGIPPVFEVGRLADERPYLAMKLIKGRTLEALLKERLEPASDRGRFLAVFEQVCQAVGYAHSKHILHRDLKPANVMVGAFGEVQVMDWGLAKHLRPGGAATHEPVPDTQTAGGTVIQTARDSATATLAGSMLGTPAFMAAEQAGGELDRIDERTDVFGLGAILCVILTCEPPYTGKSAEEVRLKAVRGTLADAHARLEQCGADAKLVDLCRRCLSAEREDRPRDAGSVAATIADYLAGVEERVRQAELERAAAEVRAAEQRKRRRVQVALAATVLVLLGLVGFGLWWQERALAATRAERVARDSRVTAGVSEALREARGRAEEAWNLAEFPARMQQSTDAALAALRRGDGFASGGAPDEITQDLALAHREIEELSRHTRLILSLDAIGHQYAADATGQDWSESQRQFARRMPEALREFGLDPLHDPVEQVAGAITSSRLRDFLLEVFLGWHWHVRDERLGQVIRLVRQKIGGTHAHWQELLDTRDVPGLVAFAASAEGLGLRPRLITHGIFIDLRDAKQFAACRTLVQAAVERYPHDEWLHFDYAGVCLEMDPPEFAEALRHSAGAVLLRPESAAFRLRLGDCYDGLGAHAQAKVCYQKAIELGHGAVGGYVHVGRALAKKKDWDGALASVREAIRRQPTSALAHSTKTIILHDAGRYAEGLKALVDASREHPELAEDPRTNFRYNAGCMALLCALAQGASAPPAGERPAYRKQALGFLTAHLDALRKLAATRPAQVHRDVQLWFEDTDLASVRGPEAISRLPADERDAWNKIWADVRALRDQTAPRSTSSSRPPG